MMTFKDFLHDPVRATSYGYEAWYIDYCALWCDRFSFKTTKKCLTEWKELFTNYTVVEFPLELLKLTLGTLVFLSIPLAFPIYAMVSYSLMNKLARNRKENRVRAMRDL